MAAMAAVELQKAAPRSAHADLYERGMSGLNYTGGWVNEEYLPNLRGREALRTYKEMHENDPVLSALYFAIVMLVRQVDWYATNHPDAKDEKAKKFLEECMADMSHSWPDFISEIMSMIPYGWSIFEVVYKIRNGPVEGAVTGEGSKFKDRKFGWRKFALRSQDSLDRWVFDPQGGVSAMIQKPPPEYQDILLPIEKMLLFRTSTYKGSPEGKSLYRGAYRPWYYKKRFEEIQGLGIERDLAGLPFAEVDPAILSDNATPEERAILHAIQNIVTNARQGTSAGIIWPAVYNEAGNKLYDFKLLTSGGARSFDINGIIQNCDQRMAMTVLGDFILLGHEGVGSFALSSDKTNLFTVALGAWLKSIKHVLNTYAVPRLFAVNNMDMEMLPQIEHGDIEKPDMQALGSMLATLASIGMPTFPDANLEDFIRKQAGLPEPTSQSQLAFEQKNEAELKTMIQEITGQGQFPPQVIAVMQAAGLLSEDYQGADPMEGDEGPVEDDTGGSGGEPYPLGE